MFDFEIAYILYKISKILAVFENNHYKSVAYYKAAMAVDAYDNYISSFLQTDKLTEITNIGNSSKKIIQEVLETGKCKLLHDLENKYGIDDYSLLLAYGLSDSVIKKLFENGITTFEKLIMSFNGGAFWNQFKPAEIDKIRIFINNYKKVHGRYLYSYAFPIGMELCDLLLSHEILSNLLLPWQEKVDEIIVEIDRADKDKALGLLDESGRFLNIKDDNSCISCKASFGIPITINLVTLSVKNDANNPLHLCGDLHMHTTWSDGIHSVEQMAERAKQLGREYIGITDHSYSLRVANGISEVDAKRQIDEIHALRDKGINVLAGIEVEVLKDGTLDFSDAILSQFDYVIAGIHTFLNQSPHEMLSRIEKALSNPYVNILAHPSGRLLGRPGILFSERENNGLSVEGIIDICRRYNVAIEFNSFPERFDISPKWFKRIFEKGVKISVGTDAHSLAHLNCLQYAEMALREFYNNADSIINTYSYEEVKSFFKNQRAHGSKCVVEDISITTHNFDYFFSNNSAILNGDLSVVGIDLTGNEEKPSGWALLQGKNVKTAMIETDDELIETTMKYNPSVVSIDSPLSYPEGRCCTKPNCECKKFGITRYCERLLSSFGIGVYPCLIPSMINLTNRGINLAKKFRARGVNVIESYPGVAQDILSIRRKQNGLQHLKSGYKSFGLVGEYFDSTSIKHDELDAIASALVGMFYVNDQYVALGNDAENYLIVPSVAPKIQKPVIIGLTGGIGAGKTTLAEYLKFKYGFKTLRYSEIICSKYDCKYERGKLQKLGYEISKDPQRQKELSELIIKEISNNPHCNYVIDGVRHQIDYDTLASQYGDNFKMLYIESSYAKAFQHYNKRVFDAITKEQFRSIYSAPSEQEIALLLFTTNAIKVTNNGTYKEYFEQVEKILKGVLCLQR